MKIQVLQSIEGVNVLRETVAIQYCESLTMVFFTKLASPRLINALILGDVSGWLSYISWRLDLLFIVYNERFPKLFHLSDKYIRLSGK